MLWFCRLTFNNKCSRQFISGVLNNFQYDFGCLRIPHYPSHYHYASQSIACSGQWEYRSQPVNCINLHKQRPPHWTAVSESTVYFLLYTVAEHSLQSVKMLFATNITRYLKYCRNTQKKAINCKTNVFLDFNVKYKCQKWLCIFN